MNYSDKKILSGKKIVISAGGTIEEIDPVRYISNYSSGKMGVALADNAFEMGAEVVLVATFNIEKPYKVVKVKSALDMQQAINNEFEGADCIIMAAAVGDFRVKYKSEQKIKKTDDEEIILRLVKNPDILRELCEKKTEHKPIIVGFCAESEDLINNAKTKIQKKGCDYLVANDISRKDIGFSSDFNEVTIFKKDGTTIKLDRDNKKNIAKKIFEVIYG